MGRIFRVLAVFTFAAAALSLALPLALYFLGLSGIEGRPPRPLHLASAEEKLAVWNRAGGSGVPNIEADNPHTYLFSVFFVQGHRPPPGKLLSLWVARDYLARCKRYEGMGWWHLSGAALAVWLSRNWTSDEIISAAAQLRPSAIDVFSGIE